MPNIKIRPAAIPVIAGTRSPIIGILSTVGERSFKTPVTALNIPSARLKVGLFAKPEVFSVVSLSLPANRTYPLKALHKIDKKYNCTILETYQKKTISSMDLSENAFLFTQVYI